MSHQPVLIEENTHDEKIERARPPRRRHHRPAAARGGRHHASASTRRPSAGQRRGPDPADGLWNTFGCNINEALIRQMTDAIVSSGMRDRGYQYVVVDDCWFNPNRDSVDLRLTDGTSAALTIVERAQAADGHWILHLIGVKGSGKTTTLAVAALRCRRLWGHRRRPDVIPVHVDLAEYTAQDVRPVRAYLERTLTDDTHLQSLLKDAWRQTEANTIWLFLFGNLDLALGQ